MVDRQESYKNLAAMNNTPLEPVQQFSQPMSRKTRGSSQYTKGFGGKSGKDSSNIEGLHVTDTPN